RRFTRPSSPASSGATGPSPSRRRASCSPRWDANSKSEGRPPARRLSLRSRKDAGAARASRPTGQRKGRWTVGTAFKKTVTRPLPPGAEVFARKGERFARWKDRKGKTRTAPLTVGKDGSERIVTESPYYVAKYRDGANRAREVATGCRDETAARQVLADLERKAELVRAGVMSAPEANAAGHQAVALAGHLDAFRQNMEAAGVTAKHTASTLAYLNRLAAECGFGRLRDFKREHLEAWLVARSREGMSART